MVRTVTSLTRILDVLELIQSDHRIQVLFTHDDSTEALFGRGTRELLDAMNVPVIPWETAKATRFDLAIAASENDQLDALDAPVMLLPHGLGFQKYYPGSRTVAGMNPDRLRREGTVIPDVIALSHPDQRDQLAAACPEALPHAVVVGDPCLDRILASRHRAQGYRKALDATHRRLILVASTWGPNSAFGTDPTLPERLLTELPADEYCVALSLHAGVWAHGDWQIRAWLARARERGLRILPVHEGWRAALLAASVVVSDRGSLGLYAAAADRPLLLAGSDTETTIVGSPMANLAGQAPRLDPSRSLREQVAAVQHAYTSGLYRSIVKQTVDGPGEAAAKIRTVLYGLLRLSEPDYPASFEPLPPPEPIGSPAAAFLVGATHTADGIILQRFADRPDLPHLEYQHVAAEIDRARLSQVNAATVLYLPTSDHIDQQARHAFEQWPNAVLIATPVGDRDCVVHTRHGVTRRYTVSAPADPRVAASVAYIGLTGTGRLTEAMRVHLGDHLIEVRVAPPCGQGSRTSWGG